MSGDIRVVCWASSSGRKPVRDWLAALDKDAFKKVDHLIGLLRRLKTDITLPYSKNLGDGLFELRDRSTGPGFRVYYTWQGNTLVILLAAGDKSSQERDIATARTRLADIGEDDR